MKSKKCVAPEKKALKVRRLKVYDKFVTRNEDRLFARYNVLFPEIRLIGKWVADSGFLPGQHIDVVVEKNKLTIVPSEAGGEEMV